MLSRRTFFKSPAVLAAPLAPVNTFADCKSPRWFGYWANDPVQFVKAKGNRWHFNTDTHDGPCIVCPSGHLPEQGQAVIIHITADLCLRRGLGEHRQRTRFVLRIHEYDESVRPLFDDQKTPLLITSEQPYHDKCYRIGAGHWLARVIEEPIEKYECETLAEDDLLALPVRSGKRYPDDIGPGELPLLPASNSSPQWRDEL
jgi:hypothetical protein